MSLVPPRLRKVNEEAYTPQVISIGPFHHGDPRLQTMEKHKLRYLRKFLERTKTSLRSFVQDIKQKEDSIRSCYAETIELGSNEFVKMILTDSTFIIEHFLRKYFPDLQDEHDRTVCKPWRQGDIKNDLILLENQLPLFVIKDLYELAFSSFQNKCPSFLELAFHFFKSFNNQGKSPQEGAKHFTDMLRSFLLPWCKSSEPTDDDKMLYIHSATELQGAGVKFKVSSTKCLLRLQFTDQVLEIPRFRIHSRTESILRNLMALEQCLYPCNTYICDYIFLMDCLINTENDVDLLIDKKIIVNGLGNSSEVATLLNNLCKHITLCEGCFFYSKISEELNNYYEVLWHSWNATFIRDYFGNPWLTASTIAAVVLLILTLVQTIFSIISLYM
eukprot:XP_025012477.1 UPF0481 protein At3g47200 isoform X2 [Ricinus communis]